MGVLSALPIISVGNWCCCLWVIAGGVIAAYVLQQNQTTPITPGDGALVGLLAGLCGAVVRTTLAIPIGFLLGPMERAMMQRASEMAGSMPPEIRDLLDQFSRDDMTRGALFIGLQMVEFVFSLFVGAIFSTLGGLIGAALFKKQPPPGVIDVPPTA
jgi:hypothetical protein